MTRPTPRTAEWHEENAAAWTEAARLARRRGDEPTAAGYDRCVASELQRAAELRK